MEVYQETIKFIDKQREKIKMTKIKKIDYNNDLTKSVSWKTQKMCADTFNEINRLAVRIKEYKDIIKLNEFKLGASRKNIS